MKFRRFISAALALTLAAAAMPSAADNVYAEDTKSEENAETAAMRNAIADVKKRVNIPKDFDGFDYETITEYDTAYYRFIWSKQEEEEGETVTTEIITVEYYNGFINGYEYRNRDRDRERSKPAFARLTPAEQEAYAKKYFYMLNPDIKGNVIINRISSDYDLFDSGARYYISREEYGIDFYPNDGYIIVDCDTGELLEFSLDWWSDAVVPDASKRLSVSEVSDIYASRKPLEANYKLFDKYEYNEETDSKKYVRYTLPVYTPTVSGENKIDAFTGEYTSMYDDKERLSYTDAYTWGRGNEEDVPAGEGYAGDGDEILDGDEDLTEAEKAALERENEFLSYEELLKIIKDDEYIVFNDELILASNTVESYSDENGEEVTCRKLYFKFTSEDETKDNISLKVSMDAFNGKILTFDKTYNYGKKSKNKNTIPLKESSAVSLAEKAAEHFIGSKAAEYRYSGNLATRYNKNDSLGAVRFTRYANDLPAPFDKMTVWVDSRGEVLYFGHTYHDIDFPEAKLVSKETAYKKLFANMKPRLYYTGFTDLQLVPHVYLTYEFESDYMINALTGERITSSGNVYYASRKEEEPKKEAVLYTDIKGHKYEKEITALWEYGIRITDSEKLNPDGAITIEEFGRLCSKAHGTNIYLSSIYPDIKTTDPDTGKVVYEDNPMLKTRLTLGELAKIYVYVYERDYFEAAALEGIYAPPYKNISQNDPNCGYIAIAKATGLISEGEEFAYDKPISRGQCLKLLYDYIAGDKYKPVYKVIRI